MKFGKNLYRMKEMSDPEWGPYWINYKYMKKKINDINGERGHIGSTDSEQARSPLVISTSTQEIEFFRILKSELKKTSHHFSCTEELCNIRHQRLREGFNMLLDEKVPHDKNMWTRLLHACVKFYKDILLLENYAVINYCGFSKILKKHDKSTGYKTREAFMINVMSKQNFTHYPYVLQLLQESEKLFVEIKEMGCEDPPFKEERLLITAIKELNSEANNLLSKEKECKDSSLPSPGSPCTVIIATSGI